MAEKKGLIDVWIVDSNTIYRDVPFTIVTDWIQQGRLLPEDRARSAGGDKWYELGKVNKLAVYFPRRQPASADDAAEAMEPVEPEFAWKTPAELEEDDVDMIPLIDVSLVLLIFFMMTAAVSSGVLSPIKTPPAKYDLATIDTDMYWLGMDVSKDKATGRVIKGADGWPTPVYSLGKGKETFNLSPKSGPNAMDSKQFVPVLNKLEAILASMNGEVRVRLRAHESLEIAEVRRVTVELQKLEAKINNQRDGPNNKIAINISGEVSEPQN